MTLTCREATLEDVPTIVALLIDDSLGAGREAPEIQTYLDGYTRMLAETDNRFFVADYGGEIVGCYQLTFITGLAYQAARRAQVESVRVASARRGQVIGRQMMRDAEARARAAGCTLFQLTTHATRGRASAFYKGLGYEPTHLGFKYWLDGR